VIEDALLWFLGGLCALLLVGLLVLCVGAATGLIPTEPDDPCVQHHAKTSDTVYHGRHLYAGRVVLCP
jgi:hypothetical protein